MQSTKIISFIFFLTILSSSLIISPTLSISTTNYNTNYTPNSKQINPNNNYTSFVRNACNTTTYPTLCLKTCLPYATKIACDGVKLAISALSVTLTATIFATSNVTTLSLEKTLGKYESNVVKDCIENMGDSIDNLKQSIEQMNEIEEYNNNINIYNNSYNSHDVGFKVSNIKTWMSAAISNEDTCMDAIKEGKVSPFVKNILRKCIFSVSKLTSMSLALCNHIQY